MTKEEREEEKWFFKGFDRFFAVVGILSLVYFIFKAIQFYCLVFLSKCLILLLLIVWRLM